MKCAICQYEMELIDLEYEKVHRCNGCLYYHVERLDHTIIDEWSIGFLDVENRLEFDKLGQRHAYAIARLEGWEVNRFPERLPIR